MSVLARSLTKSPSWAAAEKTCPDRSVSGPWTTPLLCFDLEKESLSLVGVVLRFVGRAAGAQVPVVDKREARSPSRDVSKAIPLTASGDG